MLGALRRRPEGTDRWPKTRLDRILQVEVASKLAQAKVARDDINAIWFGIAAALSIGTLGIDLAYERLFDRPPCPWCNLEQASLLLAALCTVLGVVVRRSPFPAAVLASVALLIATFGFAAAFAQPYAEKSGSCDPATVIWIIDAVRLDRVLPAFFHVGAKCDAANGLDPRFWKWSSSVFAGVGATMLLVFRNLRAPV